MLAYLPRVPASSNILLFSCLSPVQFFVIVWTTACQVSLTPLLKFAQVHVLCISDAIRASYPLMPSSPSALNLSQHQGLFQWVGCSHQMTKILELQLQHQSFQQVFRVHFPYDWLAWFPCCPRGFQESYPAPQLEGINSFTFCLLSGPVLTTVHDHWEDHSLDYMDLCQQSNVSAFQHTV